MNQSKTKNKNRMWKIGTNISTYIEKGIKLSNKIENKTFLINKTDNKDEYIFKVIENEDEYYLLDITDNEFLKNNKKAGKTGSTIYQFLFTLNSMGMLSFIDNVNVTKDQVLSGDILMCFTQTYSLDTTPLDIFKNLLNNLEHDVRYNGLIEILKSYPYYGLVDNSIDDNFFSDEENSEVIEWNKKQKNSNERQFIFGLYSAAFFYSCSANEQKKIYSLWEEDEHEGLKKTYKTMFNLITEYDKKEFKEKTLELLYGNQYSYSILVQENVCVTFGDYENLKKDTTVSHLELPDFKLEVSDKYNINSVLWPFKVFIFSHQIDKLDKIILKIPAYQRKYEWNINLVEKLFTDIFEINKNIKSYHYLGSLLLNIEEKKYSKPGDISRKKIVDGQQRLTTLFLILRAYFDHVFKNKILIPEDVFRIFVNEEEKENKLSLIFERLDTSPDFKIFKYIVTGQFSEINDKKSKMYVNYKKMMALMDKELKDDIDLCSNFLVNLLENTIMTITINQENNEFELFENMNTTNQELETMDLIKNLIFMNIDQNDLDNYEKEIFEYFLNKIEKPFNDISQDNIGRTNAFNNFIAAFVKFYKSQTKDIKLKELINNTKNNKFELYKTFKQILISEFISKEKRENNKINKKSYEKILDILNKWIYLFLHISYKELYWDLKSPLYLLGDILFTFEKRKIYTPILIKIISDKIFQNNFDMCFSNLEDLNKTREILLILESYEVRFQTVLYRGQSLTKRFEKIFDKVCENGKNIDGQKMFNILNKDILVDLSIPDDNEFKESLEKAVPDKISKILLWKLEWFFKNGCNLLIKDINHNYTRYKNPSREHIMPQTKTEWEKELKVMGNDEALLKFQNEHNKYLNLLGNALLLDENLNASASNKIFIKKKNEHYIKSENLIQSVQYKGDKKINLIDISLLNEWNFKHIETRTKQLSVILLDIYKINYS